MTATDLGHALIYPLRNRATLYAMIFYWLLFALALRAGLLGLALLAITLPAYFRFLLYLLEARAGNRPAPVPSIEMFNPAENLWTLTPIVHVALFGWAAILLEMLGSVAGAIVASTIFILATPASMAVLAVTHSPLSSLNPLAIARMARVCEATYLLIPAVLLGIVIVIVLLQRAGAPRFVATFGMSYAVVLLFSLTGSVLLAKNVNIQIDIDAPLEPSEDQLADDLEKRRQAVVNHAYGFISRGNRAGGFAHVREWLRTEADAEDAWRWFFEAMLDWENPQPALFFAQEYLCRLLDWQRDDEALKLIVRCLHENAEWQPENRSRERVAAMLLRTGREDLLRQLGTGAR